MLIAKQKSVFPSLLQENQQQIIEICEQHYVNILYTFGSVNTPKFRKDSDIDLLVSFDMTQFPIEDYADVYFDLQYQLEKLLKRDIDLVTERSIKNPYFKAEVLRTRVQFYPKPKTNG